MADLHARAARLDRLGETVARLAPDAVVIAGDVTAYLQPDPVIARLARLVDRETVLVAHPPPRGTLDEAFGRCHAGSAALRDLVLRCEPAVLLCGHIHERRGTAQLGSTLVVNCSVGRRGDGALVTVVAGEPPRAELL